MRRGLLPGLYVRVGTAIARLAAVAAALISTVDDDARRRWVVIDGGNQRGRDARQARDRGATASVQPRQAPVAAPTGPVTVPSGISVKDLSAALRSSRS